MPQPQVLTNSGITLDQIYDKIKEDGVQINTKIPYMHPFKTEGKVLNLSLGRVWFNTLLPDDFRLVNEPINKSKLDGLIKEIIEKYDPETASIVISKIQREAFLMSSIDPRSMRIDAFTLSNNFKNEREKFYQNADKMNDQEFIKESDKLTDDLMTEMDDKKIPIQDAIKAGITGKTSKATWKMLQVTKGHTVDIEGNISRITKGTAVGYDLDSYYKAGAECRSNYFTKTTAVAEPGYLARKVTMACANVKIDMKDCKTKKYLEVAIDKSNAFKFIGRNYLDDIDGKIKMVKTVDQIINKKVKFRSPLFCLDKTGICETCYGNLSKQSGTINIGILAGGAVNNEATNAMMKKRHLASQVNIKEVNFIKELRNSMVDLRMASILLDIAPTEIRAKRDVFISIDTSEYKETELVDNGDWYDVPGILEVSDENGESFILPFTFNIDLYKPENINNDRTQIILHYNPGELIIKKERYMKDLNPALISKLLDGVTKYISAPDILLNVLSDQLSKLDSVHLELIISNMFRSKKDNSIPGRLVDYKDCKIIGCKFLPFADSWLSSLGFENISKAIKVGLVQNKDASFNPIEQVLMERVGEEDDSQ